MKQYSLLRTDNFNTTMITFVGASTVAISQAQALPVQSGYPNTIYKLGQMNRNSGSSVQVRENSRQSQLSIIKSTFGLTDQELADILMVSRKTLHNWEKQGVRKEKDRQRIFELSVISEDWQYNQLPTTRDKLNLAVIELNSVMQMLKEDTLDKERIIFAGRRLAHQSLTSKNSLI